MGFHFQRGDAAYLAADAECRRWQWHGWSVIRSVPHPSGRFWGYRVTHGTHCRACRNLPWSQRWTGPNVCGCGNPYINSEPSRRPQDRPDKEGRGYLRRTGNPRGWVRT